ncbi:asparagine synthase (glutamine-hydrolyzing) [Aliiglaciecola sp. CAU 1673]|uniref:asparagine synthase (glutamine-hydrolyzing) n=1 Tax=Aliiglaciecola sp. CAU 1673 TaxID=3032595 RepID=UPI0023DB365D|nr:asparagine synthase (glutamine-hydrolyzing) [Aliiglaciecola sp. CAU 1673]MDF2179432.1 asparagine synthase (glutamine-hydrolyzing) [Aliiglaciecola sp. CAU 1673]
MCGIAGIFASRKQNDIDSQVLVNMAAIMHHRGPDNYGYCNPAGVGMGMSHARLSIIDLNESRGRQPFFMHGGQLIFAHNGEFYDYQRIRAELTAQGEHFETKSDSEIVPHLYLRLGMQKTLPHLRGEFAFALYDEAKDSLYLVRDRFGIKPLYWTQTDDHIVFGSEVKTVLAHPQVQAEFDNKGLFHQLIQVMVPGTTAFKGIHQVEPGHMLKITRHQGRFKIETHKYWDMDFPLPEARPRHDDEYYVEGVRRELLEAVQLRLNADVPVGCYLSGGIDSCSILGLASSASQFPIRAFTIGFDHDEYDEATIATEMARATGAEQDILKLNADLLYDNFARTLWHTERTIYNTLAVAKLMMSQHVTHNQYKVVLTGEGSDELFAGYPAFRKDMFLHGMEGLDSAQAAEWQRTLADSNKLFQGAMLPKDEYVSDAINAKVGFTPSCLQPWLGCSELARQLLHPDIRDELAEYEPGTAIAAKLDDSYLEGRHPLDKAQYVWIKTMLEGQILTWGGDRVDMANSMEARPPFLDHHLAEFAATIPPQLRIKGSKEKHVLREAMKGLLPTVLYERQKFAFMAPPAHTDDKKWKKLKGLFEKYASPSALAKTGLVDSDFVQTLMARQESESTPAADKVQIDALLNHVLGVMMLHRHFVEQDIPALAHERAQALGWVV